MPTTDPAKRAEFTAGLRQLADYLDANPRLPVPDYGADITIIASDAEEGGITEILGLSMELGAAFRERDGFYRTARAFGPVTYKGVSQTRTSSARWAALNSYRGCVIPDDRP